MADVTMAAGQSVALTAKPTVRGIQGGVFPGPVSWSNNANLIGINPVMNTAGDTCTLQIPADTVPSGSFTVTATSGNLTANVIVLVTPPPADGMIIEVGPVM